MPSLKPASLRDLKLRVNIADAISRVVTLRKAGGTRLKGLCPFHNEKTPSFHVDPDKGLYHCFGCNKSGDVISFVRETEQLNFIEAVEALAQRFSVVLEYEDGAGPTREDRSLRQELFDLHDAAAEHFRQAFLAQDATGGYMRDYWTQKRRFSPALAEEFRIGAADAAGSGLGAALLRRKYSEEAIRKCGLFFVREDAVPTAGALRHRFRGRLMIPIRDHQGRIVAFTARQTDLTPEDDPAREAKYVNSPETPIFIKGNLLFNLDRARAAVGEGRPFVLVEGQLDAMRCWDAGLKTAVAPQGTAITDSQLVLLRRYHPEIECLFDSDSAGRKASLRLLPLALRAGLEVRFLQAPGDGKVDPDLLFLERGLDAYAELKRASRGAMAFACAAALPDFERMTEEQRARGRLEVFEIIRSVESRAVQEAYLHEAARHMGAAYNALCEDFARQAARRPAAPPVETRPAANATITAGYVANTTYSRGLDRDLITQPQTQLIGICLQDEAVGRAIARVVRPEWLDPSAPFVPLLNRILLAMEHADWQGASEMEHLIESDQERQLVDHLLVNPLDFDELPARAGAQLLTALRASAIKPRLRQIELDLANHRADSNSDPISLSKQHTELLKQLRQPLELTLVG